MVVTEISKGDQVELILMGELDEHNAKINKEYVDDLIKNSKSKQIVMILSKLTFMDSTGIGFILGRYKLCKSLAKEMYIKNTNISLDRVLNMSGVYSLVKKIS